MEAKAKLFGHPIHQMLVPIPFGLLAIGALLDVADRFVDIASLSVVSFYNIAIGVVFALVAALFGIIDWSAIPSGTRAKRIGMIHAGANVLVAGSSIFGGKLTVAAAMERLRQSCGA